MRLSERLPHLIALLVASVIALGAALAGCPPEFAAETPEHEEVEHGG